MEYNQADTLRPDRSLFSYGFVPALDRPLLCMVDLPPGFPSDSPVDPPYGGARRRQRARSCCPARFAFWARLRQHAGCLAAWLRPHTHNRLPAFHPGADPASQYATQAEYDRLAAALAAAPTTEAEDQAALGSGRYPGAPRAARPAHHLANTTALRCAASPGLLTLLR